MKAKWEYGYDDYEEDYEDRSIAFGWEPFAVHEGKVLIRRLVVARCEAGHDADFDWTACLEGAEYRDCGKAIVAVPVDPYDLAFGKEQQG